MRRKSLLLALALPALVATPAQAGTYYADPDITNAIPAANGWYHEYDVTYTCGVDGTITFTGTGRGADVENEQIDGTMNPTGDRSFFFTTVFPSQFAYTVTGTLGGTSTTGTLPYTGTALVVGSNPNSGEASLGDVVVPSCAPEPVAGNHGEYVSGAAKAGVKGAALAAIAKDKSKVGPYPG